MDVRRWRGTILAISLGMAAVGSPAATAGEPSPEYQASLKRTLELRRQRRGQVRARGGTIATYPMPPALVIRQTREKHEEVQALLDLLRYGSR